LLAKQFQEEEDDDDDDDEPALWGQFTRGHSPDPKGDHLLTTLSQIQAEEVSVEGNDCRDKF
jgi:hypothetical protein